MKLDSTSSSTSTAAYSSSGLSGLMSGVDTESLVASMLSNIQTKIDQQNQSKQSLEWKQDMYRDIITKVNDFSDKYFSITSSSSLRSSELYGKTITESSSSAIKVVSNNSYDVGEVKMSVSQLASAATVQSSKVNTNGSISVNMDNNTVGRYDRNINIKIGDTEYNDIDLSSCSSESDILNAINGAVGSNFASVKVTQYKSDGTALTDDDTYDEDEGCYTLRQLQFDSSENFTISGTSAGLFTMGLSSAVSSNEVKEDSGVEGEEPTVTGHTLTVGIANTTFSASGSLDIVYDGVKKSISITEGQDFDEVVKNIQNAFGKGITFDKNNGTFSVADGHQLTMSASEETMKLIGIDNSLVTTQTNISSKVSTLDNMTFVDGKATLNINDCEIEIDENDTISQVMGKINSSDSGVIISYNDLSDTFTLKQSNSGSGFDIDISDNSGFLKNLGFNVDNSGDLNGVTAGKDAILTINGTEVKRSTNDVTYNGLTVKLNATTNGEDVTISSARDTDKIVSALKNFVDDYNTLIGDLNKLTHEDASCKKYPPLTEAQKKEMTEKEIEQWEAKSKTGLLRNDSDISKFLQEMRSAIFSGSNTDSKYVLSNIGIDSSSNWQDYGKLSINEDTLKSFIEGDIEGVANIFMGDNGLANRLKTVCSNAANTSSASRGTLVSLAGVKGKGTEKDNVIYKRLQNISTKLTELQRQYDTRKTRYWKQFDSMETSLSSLNSQQSWMQSAFSY